MISSGGIDYLGESGIGRWWYDGDVPGEHYERPLYPWHAAYCGDIDLTGWRKPISHYRNLLYNDTEKLYMAVREPDGYYGKIRSLDFGQLILPGRVGIGQVMKEKILRLRFILNIR